MECHGASIFSNVLALTQSPHEEGDAYRFLTQRSASNGRWYFCREAPDCRHDVCGFTDPGQTVILQAKEDRNTKYTPKRGKYTRGTSCIIHLLQILLNSLEDRGGSSTSA